MELRLSGGRKSPVAKMTAHGLKGPTLTCVEQVLHYFQGAFLFVVVFKTDEAMGVAQHLTGWAERGGRTLEVPFNGGFIKTNEPGTSPRYYEKLDLVEGRSRSEFVASTKNVVRATYALQVAMRGLGLKL